MLSSVVAMSVFQNKETATIMLVYQTKHVEVELFSNLNSFFCFNTLVWLLNT